MTMSDKGTPSDQPARSLSRTTPFPNYLLDEAMPRLRDTEWRLLCVIVRQTLGWQERGSKNRKVSDWLTQTQLVEKTGRDRAAISRALDALVLHRYIEVRNEKGHLLQLPTERRHNKGRLFFGLHPRLLRKSLADTTGAKNEYQVPHSNSLLATWCRKSELHHAPKANTTKETVTKETATKESTGESLKFLAGEVLRGDASVSDRPATPSSLTYAGHGHSGMGQEFIALFKQLYDQTKGQRADITLSSPDVERLEKLLASHPSLDWTPLLESFFESDFNYITRRNYSLIAFLDTCNIFVLRCSAPFGKRHGKRLR
jgi:hypothetical protein